MLEQMEKMAGNPGFNEAERLSYYANRGLDVDAVISDEMAERLSLPRPEVLRTDSVDEVSALLREERGLLTWALDGQPLTLVYNEGVLLRAVARGDDGAAGLDVTCAVMKVRDIPLKIPHNGLLEVYGDAVMSWAQFFRIRGLNVDTGTPARLAGDACRDTDAGVCREYGLRFYAAGMNAARMYRHRFDELAFLKELGFFAPVNAEICRGLTPYQVSNLRKVWNPGKCPCPSTGLVFAIDCRLSGFSGGPAPADIVILEHPYDIYGEESMRVLDAVGCGKPW